MTYGVDQCRRCGKPIKEVDPLAMDRHLNSLTRKPTMTPKEWEAAGWKAAPTHYQIHRPLDGVCYSCKPAVHMQRKHMRMDRTFLGLGLFLTTMFALLWFLATLTHSGR